MCAQACQRQRGISAGRQDEVQLRGQVLDESRSARDEAAQR